METNGLRFLFCVQPFFQFSEKGSEALPQVPFPALFLHEQIEFGADEKDVQAGVCPKHENDDRGQTSVDVRIV